MNDRDWPMPNMRWQQCWWCDDCDPSTKHGERLYIAASNATVFDVANDGDIDALEKRLAYGLAYRKAINNCLRWMLMGSISCIND